MKYPYLITTVVALLLFLIFSSDEKSSKIILGQHDIKKYNDKIIEIKTICIIT